MATTAVGEIQISSGDSGLLGMKNSFNHCFSQSGRSKRKSRAFKSCTLSAYLPQSVWKDFDGTTSQDEESFPEGGRPQPMVYETIIDLDTPNEGTSEEAEMVVKPSESGAVSRPEKRTEKEDEWLCPQSKPAIEKNNVRPSEKHSAVLPTRSKQIGLDLRLKGITRPNKRRVQADIKTLHAKSTAARRRPKSPARRELASATGFGLLRIISHLETLITSRGSDARSFEFFQLVEDEHQRNLVVQELMTRSRSPDSLHRIMKSRILELLANWFSSSITRRQWIPANFILSFLKDLPMRREWIDTESSLIMAAALRNAAEGSESSKLDERNCEEREVFNRAATIHRIWSQIAISERLPEKLTSCLKKSFRVEEKKSFSRAYNQVVSRSRFGREYVKLSTSGDTGSTLLRAYDQMLSAQQLQNPKKFANLIWNAYLFGGLPLRDSPAQSPIRQKPKKVLRFHGVVATDIPAAKNVHTTGEDGCAAAERVVDSPKTGPVLPTSRHDKSEAQEPTSAEKMSPVEDEALAGAKIDRSSKVRQHMNEDASNETSSSPSLEGKSSPVSSESHTDFDPPSGGLRTKDECFVECGDTELPELVHTLPTAPEAEKIVDEELDLSKPRETKEADVPTSVSAKSCLPDVDSRELEVEATKRNTSASQLDSADIELEVVGTDMSSASSSVQKSQEPEKPRQNGATISTEGPCSDDDQFSVTDVKDMEDNSRDQSRKRPGKRPYAEAHPRASEMKSVVDDGVGAVTNGNVDSPTKRRRRTNWNPFATGTLSHLLDILRGTPEGVQVSSQSVGCIDLSARKRDGGCWLQ